MFIFEGEMQWTMNRAVAANSNTAKYFNEFYVFIET